MDERPDTGAEWMSLVGRRLARLERRQRTPIPADVVYLVPASSVSETWLEVPELVGLGPAGWAYVRQAVPEEAEPEQET